MEEVRKMDCRNLQLSRCKGRDQGEPMGRFGTQFWVVQKIFSVRPSRVREH
jgi:hypothetical protein